MSAATIARNYAEALFDLGERSRQTAAYADLIDAVAAAIDNSPEVQGVLMSPRVPKSAKAKLLETAMGSTPREFVLFLQAVVHRGRQGLFREIAVQFAELVDIKLNRVRAGVTLARTPDPALVRSIQEQLSAAMGKEVITSFTTDPDILGGTIVRIGERIYDGSIRRRLTKLRRQLLAH